MPTVVRETSAVLCLLFAIAGQGKVVAHNGMVCFSRGEGFPTVSVFPNNKIGGEMGDIAVLHYHVVIGYRGCIPESNEIYMNYRDALETAKEIVREEGEMHLLSPRGLLRRKNLHLGEEVFWEKGGYSTFYVQVYPCDEPQCMEEFSYDW